ncbi:MAG: hypothetical protein CBARDCOR_0139 [uncultured Caballeronia sp.]|nr:MAG: hypothetical protein CBARDCOR_0139 [uncultured Caballeronia sp.]
MNAAMQAVVKRNTQSAGNDKVCIGTMPAGTGGVENPASRAESQTFDVERPDNRRSPAKPSTSPEPAA